jgi:5,10-methylenetetrahydromethanopterin reductase
MSDAMQSSGPLVFGLNRWDWRSPESFAAQVSEAEQLGLGCAFLPVNPLAVPDPYLLMGAAAMVTEKMRFGPLLETPRIRPPAVAAGSIASLDIASEGRAMLTFGVGDTAVRWLGDRPATVAELESSVSTTKALLGGKRVDVGAAEPAYLRHARAVPVWVAAGGPRTLRMAGRVADGVFIRAGTHPAILDAAVAEVRAGAESVGRDPSELRMAVVVHTIRSQDPSEIAAISRAMAAGFHEYSPSMFAQAGLTWEGPPIEDLKRQVSPDFHHTTDLVGAGDLVSFLSDEIADSFSFHGSPIDIVDQLARVRDHVPGLEIVVPHPVPMPTGGDVVGYVRWMADNLMVAI